MIRLPEQNSGAEIKFPLTWSYRAVVESNHPEALDELNAVLSKFGFSTTFSANHASTGGKYQSFVAKVLVPDQKIMNELGDALAKVPGVKFLL